MSLADTFFLILFGFHSPCNKIVVDKKKFFCTKKEKEIQESFTRNRFSYAGSVASYIKPVLHGPFKRSYLVKVKEKHNRTVD